MSKLVAIALGSNLGDGLELFCGARTQLLIKACCQPGSLISGGLYRSEPIGCPPGSPPFLNSAIWLETELTPLDLLDLLQSLEDAAGRMRSNVKNAARTLDLDLIFHGDERRTDERLELPHPRFRQRLFVVAPLADAKPGFTVDGESLEEMRKHLEGEPGPGCQLLRADW